MGLNSIWLEPFASATHGAVGGACGLAPLLTVPLTETNTITAFAFNVTFLIILLVVSSPTRSVSLQKITSCFFAGGLALGLALTLTVLIDGTGTSGILHTNKVLRPLLLVPIEELFKLLPAPPLFSGKGASSTIGLSGNGHVADGSSFRSWIRVRRRRIRAQDRDEFSKCRISLAGRRDHQGSDQLRLRHFGQLQPPARWVSHFLCADKSSPPGCSWHL